MLGPSQPYLSITLSPCSLAMKTASMAITMLLPSPVPIWLGSGLRSGLGLGLGFGLDVFALPEAHLGNKGELLLTMSTIHLLQYGHMLLHVLCPPGR